MLMYVSDVYANRNMRAGAHRGLKREPDHL